MKIVTSLFPLLLLTIAVCSADAHDGRRLAVVVENGQLFAHGYNSGANDGRVSPRPYYNAIHGHWHNKTVGMVDFAEADLPSFDLFGPSTVGSIGVGAPAGALAGESLTLTLLGAGKWTPPGGMPFGEVVTAPLAGETITVDYGAQSIDTDSLGSLTLASGADIDSLAGAVDLDLGYRIDGHPAGGIYILEWMLSTSASGIADSDAIFTILSPQMMLHHQSLHAEAQLGTAIVPEPAAAALAVALLCALPVGRRRSR